MSICATAVQKLAVSLDVWKDVDVPGWLKPDENSTRKILNTRRPSDSRSEGFRKLVFFHGGHSTSPRCDRRRTSSIRNPNTRESQLQKLKALHIVWFFLIIHHFVIDTVFLNKVILWKRFRESHRYEFFLAHLYSDPVQISRSHLSYVAIFRKISWVL